MVGVSLVVDAAARAAILTALAFAFLGRELPNIGGSAPDPSYDLTGTPNVTINITDNDSFHVTKVTGTTTLTAAAATSASLWSELPIN